MTAPNDVPKRPPLFFEVPFSAEWSLCRSCGTRMYWILSPKRGKRMPIDCDVEGGSRPKVIETADGKITCHGKGVSHHSVCPAADQWRARDSAANPHHPERGSR